MNFLTCRESLEELNKNCENATKGTYQNKGLRRELPKWRLCWGEGFVTNLGISPNMPLQGIIPNAFNALVPPLTYALGHTLTFRIG